MDEIIIQSKRKYYTQQAIEVKNELLNRYKGTNIEGRQYSQIITYLNALYKKEHSNRELASMITDGSEDAGLADAFVFCKDSVDIFDIKEEKNLKLNEVKQLRDRLKEYIFIKPDFKKFKNIRLVAPHIKKFHSPANKRRSINVYIIRSEYTRHNYEDKNINNILKEIEGFPGVKVSRITNNTIVNLILEHNFIQSWQINKTVSMPLREEKMALIKDEYEYIIVMLPIKEVLTIYHRHIMEGKDFFSQNIRLPKKIVKFRVGISETIKKNVDNFFIFHNGITITAKKIASDARSYYVYEPQVVNGAQTIGNLYSEYKNDLSNNDLKKASIICKIVKADQDLSDKICETSNTQKAVKIEQLRVNDSFQKKMEIYLHSESGGQYEYIRKEKKKFAKSRAIKYTQFFQWSYSVFLNKPAAAKNAKSLIFEKDKRGEYEKIKFEIEKNIDNILLLCKIGVFVEDEIKKEKDGSKKSFLRSANLHLISGLFNKKTSDKKMFDLIYKILNNYSEQEIKKDKNLNLNKIFTKKDSTWKFLRNELSKL